MAHGKQYQTPATKRLAEIEVVFWTLSCQMCQCNPVYAYKRLSQIESTQRRKLNFYHSHWLG